MTLVLDAGAFLSVERGDRWVTPTPHLTRAD